jgi:heptosyltransferase III
MNILFVTSNRLGDAVLSTGLLGHVIDRHPGAAVTVACGPAAAALFAATPGVARVIAMPKRRAAGHWIALWAKALPRFWHLAIDLRGSALPYFLLARQRHVLRPGKGPVHRVRHIGALLGLRDPPSPRVMVGENHRAEARRLLPPGAPVLALGPTANWGGKMWPADRFAALAARLTAKGAILGGARVAVFGAPSERDLAAPLLAALPPESRVDLVGRAELLTVAACLERAALFVGNDSGLMHLAAASGAPTLGLFGPSREELYAPWGAHCASVRAEQSFDEIITRPDYDYRRQDSHMLGLSVDKVAAAAETLWRRRSAAA